MRTRGFTLIELLVVISVIAVLLGLLFPTITLVRNMARKAKTQTTLGQICSALEKYRDVNGNYPDSYGTPDVYAKSFMTGATPNEFGAIGDDNFKNVNAALGAQLNTVDRDAFSGGPILDSFGSGAGGEPFRYRPWKFYPYKDGATMRIDRDNDTLPNPDGYQVWSKGKNGRDEAGEPGTDDVKNWK
jgi:prepilin-type N-terminal cleavage/methylation domain-containing protein